MELRTIIEQVKADHSLSQNEVAQRIGMTKENLSSVLHGRRKLPAEAAIELFDLTGIHPREILNASVEQKETARQQADRPLNVWRARDDSNVRPLPSEGSTLSS